MRLPAPSLTILLFLLAHIGLALSIPLVEDEAYYALWAAYPDWGYYDHPPVIAWLIAAGESAFGQNRLGVRSLAVLSFALSAALVCDVARAIGGEHAARRTALFYCCGLVVFLSGFVATPDAPSVLFWSAGLWAATRVLQNPQYWLAAGLFAGLGVISKFTNLFLGAGFALWLIASPIGRRQLLTPWPWAALLLAALVMAPTFWWNLQMDWLGLERQFGRVGARQFNPVHLLSFLVILFFFVSPMVAFGSLRAALRPASQSAGLLVLSSLPLLAYFLFHSTSAQVQANWPLPLAAPIAVLAGVYSAGWSQLRVWSAALLGLAPAFVILVAGFFPGVVLMPGHTLPNQTRGWPAFADALSSELGKVPGATWLATAEYGLTGALAFQRPDLTVRAVHEVQRYSFLPGFPPDLCEAPALYVHRDRRGLPAPDALFRVVGEEFALSRSSGNSIMATYRVWPVQGLRACPPS